MRYSHVLGAAIVGLAAAATTAQAGLSVSLVPVNNTGQGLPSGARTFDLRVVADAGTKWASADLQFSLVSTGKFAGTSFYNSTGNGNTETAGGTGTVAFDTYVSSPLRSASGTGAVSILGKAQYPTESGVGAAVFPTNASGDIAVDAAWGDTGAAAAVDGTYRIARFTILGNGGAYLNGRVGATNNSIAPVTFTNVYMPILGDVDLNGQVNFDDFVIVKNNFNLNASGDTNGDGLTNFDDFVNVKNNFNNNIAAPAPTLGAVVPEPTSLAVIALGSVLMTSRRRGNR